LVFFAVTLRKKEQRPCYLYDRAQLAAMKVHCLTRLSIAGTVAFRWDGRRNRIVQGRRSDRFSAVVQRHSAAGASSLSGRLGRA
jgi:hypothetical protein